MGLSDNGDENTVHRFEDLCLDLNMDPDAKAEAWEAFEMISTNYTLEVKNRLHFVFHLKTNEFQSRFYSVYDSVLSSVMNLTIFLCFP